MANRSTGKRAHASGTTRRSRVPLLIAGGVIVAMALIVFLFLRPSRGPVSRPKGETRAGETNNDELALRDETIAAARQLVAEFPRDVSALGLMGTVYNQFGNTVEAETWWRKCMALDPARPDVFEVLATAYLSKGEYKKVIDLADDALNADPQMPGGHRFLAEARLELGDLGEALLAIEREIELNPDASEAYVVLGRIQVQRKAYPEAIKAYSKALDLRPGDSRCYFGMATAATRLGQTEKAAEYQAKFASLRDAEDAAAQERRRAKDVLAPTGPILAQFLVDAGRTYQVHDQADKAQACWKRAASADPANLDCRLELVGVYRKSHRLQEAADMCAQLTAIRPSSGGFYALTGEVQMEQERPDAAQASLQKAVELAPTARHYYLLGQAAFRNHDRAAALVAVERAAVLDPDNEQIHKALETLQRGP